MISEIELRYALMEAKCVALHSSRCLRKRVGAILFSNEGKFLAYGANINPPGKPCDEGHCPRGQKSYAERAVDSPYDDCTAWHAEMVALLVARERLAIRLGEGHHEITNGTLVVTHEPCHECMPRLQVLPLNVYWPEGKWLAS